MKEVNGDWLIKIMSQSEWSDEVLDLLDICELERVNMYNEYSVDIRVQKYGIDLKFGWQLCSEKQRAKPEERNLYFQGVSFREECTISLPFGLKQGEDRKTCVQKIADNAKIVHIFRWDYLDSFLLEDEDKKYIFDITYTNNENHLLVNIGTFTWDIDMDMRYYIPNELTLQEALNG